MDHVFVIVMENHSFGEVVGSTSAPYFNSLIPAGGLGSKYYAVTHPSLPNYLALAGASTFGITSDCTTCWVNASNIADTIEGVGSTWKAYMESMPAACFMGDSYPYAQKHNPFIYFNDIRTNSTRCAQHILPYTQMSTDLQSTTTTPNYAFITPNMCNDTHDCAVSSGDNWLKAQVPVILGSPAFKTQHSLLAIVWDEDDSSASNQVPILLLGSAAKPGATSLTSYGHYSLLHTIENGLGVTTLTTNDTAAPMTDLLAVGAPPSPSPSPTPERGSTSQSASSVSLARQPVHQQPPRVAAMRTAVTPQLLPRAHSVASQAGRLASVEAQASPPVSAGERGSPRMSWIAALLDYVAQIKQSVSVTSTNITPGAAN
jgi:phosphatidylinositol-3-phosphatase